jgi:glycosyltransferase involved in cell wall biosynthesis
VSTKTSVIICAYNYAGFLQCCLESVISQTRPADEIIVVDDGSTDETPNVVACLPRAKYIRQHHSGKAAAFNRGFAASEGDVICHLDADDYWLPKKLEETIDVLSQSEAGGLTHDAFYVDGEGNLLYGSKPEGNGQALPRHLSFRDVLLMCFTYRPRNGVQGTLGVVNTLCVQRQAVADFLPLPEALGLAVDGALLLGAARTGLVYLPKKLSAYRHHERNHFVRSPIGLEYQRRLFRWAPQLTGVSGTYERSLLEALALQEDVQAAMALSEQPLKTAFKASALPPKLLRLGLIPHWKHLALPMAALLRWRKIRGAFQRPIKLS